MARQAMRGFTLVELVVVMLVITVLAAVAMPRFTDRNALQERGLRDQLKAMLDHARKTAQAQQRDVCVLVGANQVRAVYALGGVCAAAMPLAEPSGTNPFVLPLPAGVVLGGNLALRFNARGQPVPNADQTLALGTLALSISRETGIVQ